MYNKPSSSFDESRPNHEGTIVDSYKLGKKIGSGAFGELYLARHVVTNEKFAAKLEPTNTKHPQLKYEAKIYSCLKGGKGIPAIYYYGEVGDYY